MQIRGYLYVELGPSIKWLEIYVNLPMQHSLMQCSNSNSLCINNHLQDRWGYFDKVCIPDAKANAWRHSNRALHFSMGHKLYHNKYVIYTDELDYFANNFMEKAYLYFHYCNSNKQQRSLLYNYDINVMFNIKHFREEQWNYPLVTLVVTTGTIILGPGLLRNPHVKIHVSWQRLSNIASDWLAAQLPANQKPC